MHGRIPRVVLAAALVGALSFSGCPISGSLSRGSSGSSGIGETSSGVTGSATSGGATGSTGASSSHGSGTAGGTTGATGTTGSHSGSGAASSGSSGASSSGASSSGAGSSTGGATSSGGSTGGSSTGGALAPGFYVATSGSDSNPGTLAAPFATLAKAQQAMQASSTIKTTYVRSGTYTPPSTGQCASGGTNAALALTSGDSGETWSYYPPDGYGSAIIDGQSTSTTTGLGCAFSASGATNLTIVGLQMQRFIDSGVQALNGKNVVITGNTVHDTTAGIFNVGGVDFFCTTDSAISNNYIHDIAYMGVGIWNWGCSGGISNDTVSGNLIVNSCTTPAVPGGNDQNGGDCGAIYALDLNPVASTNIQIANNYIRDVNASSNGVGDYSGCCATGIYLDNSTSSASVTGNVVTGIKSDCFQIHGGQNDVITGNVCDLDGSGTQSIVFAQQESVTDFAMAGNVFEGNIVVADSSGAGSGFSGSPPTTTPTTTTPALRSPPTVARARTRTPPSRIRRSPAGTSISRAAAQSSKRP
jgi:hypothetical protein